MGTTIHFSRYSGGYIKCGDVVKAIVADLVANGFDKVFPTADYDGTGVVILEPKNTVDSLRGEANDKKTWRLAFKVDEANETIQFNAATHLQLQDDGTIAKATGWTAEKLNPGEVEKWVDRSVLKANDLQNGSVYPMSYVVSVSDHGVFVGIWDQAFDEYQDEFKVASPAFRWLLVQRPVDNETGTPLVTGRAPVFCVYTTLSSGYIQASPEFQYYNTPNPPKILYGEQEILMRETMAQFHYKFVVCEEDIFRPSLTKPADLALPDSNPIFNANFQVSVSEDNKYVITIPKGLNTSRYAYTHELDMIAYTSADVVGQFTEVDLPLYGTTYKYKALPATRTKNTGMRILYRTADTAAPAATTTPAP